MCAYDARPLRLDLHFDFALPTYVYVVSVSRLNPFPVPVYCMFWDHAGVNAASGNAPRAS